MKAQFVEYALGKPVGRTLSLPIDLFNNVFVSYIEQRELKTEEMKEAVLDFIKKYKSATIVNICNNFNLELDESLLIFKKLKEEGRIQVTGGENDIE